MPGSGLSAIEHVVVLMLENRSFDHMLGFLYGESGNVSPTGHPFEGLTGTESNPDASGSPVTVFSLTAPRTDDVLAGVTVPAAGAGPSAGLPSHLQEVQAELISRQYPAGHSDIPGAARSAFTEEGLRTYIHSYARTQND